jgi:hypothetical protein
MITVDHSMKKLMDLDYIINKNSNLYDSYF